MTANKPIPTASEELFYQAYWEGAREEKLMIQRCSHCRHWIHFPEPRCPHCASNELCFEPVSGCGHVESYSIVERSFVQGFDTPYALAWIALPEQAGLRVLANIIDCPLASIQINQAVHCVFEQRGEFTLPQFTPDFLSEPSS
jgi:uncharacterized OB-fold protein